MSRIAVIDSPGMGDIVRQIVAESIRDGGLKGEVMVVGAPSRRDELALSLRDNGRPVALLTEERLQMCEPSPVIVPTIALVPIANRHRELQREMKALAAAQRKPLLVGGPGGRTLRPGVDGTYHNPGRTTEAKAERKRRRKARHVTP